MDDATYYEVAQYSYPGQWFDFHGSLGSGLWIADRQGYAHHGVCSSPAGGRRDDATWQSWRTPGYLVVDSASATGARPRRRGCSVSRGGRKGRGGAGAPAAFMAMLIAACSGATPMASEPARPAPSTAPGGPPPTQVETPTAPDDDTETAGVPGNLRTTDTTAPSIAWGWNAVTGAAYYEIELQHLWPGRSDWAGLVTVTRTTNAYSRNHGATNTTLQYRLRVRACSADADPACSAWTGYVTLIPTGEAQAEQ